MRMQVILDSLFVRPGSAPIGGGKKGEFRDWTTNYRNIQGYRVPSGVPSAQAMYSASGVSCTYLNPYIKLKLI